LNLQGFEYIQKIEKQIKGQWADFQRRHGSRPARTALAWPSPPRRAAHNQVGHGPRLSSLAAHNRVVCLGAARAACALSAAACTLGGGMHAQRCGDFTDAGGWPATHSKQRRSTQTERRSRWQCLPASEIDGKSGGARLFQ
jgi:hypothetical protein